MWVWGLVWLLSLGLLLRRRVKQQGVEEEDLGEVRCQGIRFKVTNLYLWDGNLCITCVSDHRGDFVMGGPAPWSLFGPDGRRVATFRQDFPEASSKDGTVTLLLSVHISEVGAW